MRLLIALLFALTLAGCATLGQPVKTYSADEIIDLTKAGRPANEIIGALEDGRGSYAFKASELARMGQAGVPAEVLDYLQARMIADVRRDERWRNDPYFYPWGPYWWRPYGPYFHTSIYYYRGRPYPFYRWY